MATITFTMDDDLYSQIVAAYCAKYQYADHAQLGKDGVTLEGQDAFGCRMIFEDIKTLVTAQQQAPAIQAAADTVAQAVASKTSAFEIVQPSGAVIKGASLSAGALTPSTKG